MWQVTCDTWHVTCDMFGGWGGVNILSKGTKGFLHCSFKSGAFHVLKGISPNIFLQISFFLVLTPRTCFGFNDFHIFHIHKKKQRRPLLNQLFSKSVLMSTLAEPNQINLGFVITNDKASNVAKEDSICLFLTAKEATLNEQWIKHCVPFSSLALTVCDLWYYEDLEEKAYRSMSNEAVYRTAPPTPGLLIIFFHVCHG